MANFMTAIGNMFHNAANGVRQANLTPQQIEDRANGKRLLEMVKVASIVSVVGALFFVAIFPKIFTLVLAGVVALGASEVYKTAQNILEMLNKAAVELVARTNKENLINQLAKDTLMVGPILRAIDPPLADTGILLA